MRRLFLKVVGLITLPSKILCFGQIQRQPHFYPHTVANPRRHCNELSEKINKCQRNFILPKHQCVIYTK